LDGAETIPLATRWESGVEEFGDVGCDLIRQRPQDAAASERCSIMAAPLESGSDDLDTDAVNTGLRRRRSLAAGDSMLNLASYAAACGMSEIGQTSNTTSSQRPPAPSDRLLDDVSPCAAAATGASEGRVGGLRLTIFGTAGRHQR
jgi:hypothetical protein